MTVLNEQETVIDMQTHTMNPVSIAPTEGQAPIDPVRAAMIETADPSRIKKRVVDALTKVRTLINDGTRITDESWDALVELTDLYYDILDFREKEKVDAEVAKAAKLEVIRLQEEAAKAEADRIAKASKEVKKDAK